MIEHLAAMGAVIFLMAAFAIAAIGATESDELSNTKAHWTCKARRHKTASHSGRRYV